MQPTEQPTEPTECTEANKGRCECGKTTQGITTYTFWSDGLQRCFTIYRPKEKANEKLPLLIYAHCYSEDRLQSLSMKSPNQGWNKAATRYGFARLAISSPTGGWKFSDTGIINDTYPMEPCSTENRDIKYVKKVLEFITANDDKFDTSKIWIHGFSQNSVFSAMIGYCFSDYFTGIWQGGSGMAKTGLEPYPPGCSGQVSRADWKVCKENNIPCSKCIEKYPCTDCQYWPIYPCYSPKKPMVECLAAYDNDYIATSKTDLSQSGVLHMYNALKDEGHDARLLRFAKSEDGTITGGHKDPKNVGYWVIGCLGITDQCSESCEASFIDCVESGDTSTALKRTKAFGKCIKAITMAGLEGCTKDCAPTFNMLTSSEMPSFVAFERFGAGTGVPISQPETSRCKNTDFLDFLE